jgi:prepilin-type processing-associated H-X9-DG protein
LYISPNGSFATGILGGRNAQFARQLTSPPGSGMTGRHVGGSNYLFCDGHAKWLQGAQVSNGYGNNDSNCPQDSSDLSSGGTCNNVGQVQAAGTSSSTFAGTMSAI